MLQHTIPRCNTLQSYLYPLQHNATHYNTMQHAARHCNIISAHTATQCDMLQHNVTHCNTLQHTATVSLPIARARAAFCLRVRAFHRGAQNLGPLRNFWKVNTKPNLLPKSTIDLCFEKFRVGAWYWGAPHPHLFENFWKVNTLLNLQYDITIEVTFEKNRVFHWGAPHRHLLKNVSKVHTLLNLQHTNTPF